MKRLLLAMIGFMFCVAAWAQEVVSKCEYRASKNNYGLYNERTQKWVVQPQYRSSNYLGSYEGVHYYALQNWDNLWGIITSEDFSKTKIGHVFSDIYATRGFRHAGGIPQLGVKKGTNWGYIELYTSSCYYLYPAIYSSLDTRADGNGIYFRDWDGKGHSFWSNDIKARFDECVALDKKKEELRRKNEEEARKREQERQARLKKEKELASFTEYAKNYVTPKINEWQKKGEFEKLADYQIRVTGESRLEKIAEYTKEAEGLFIAEHEKMDHLKNMTLEAYDSESEVFSIKSAKFGQLLLPVPISDGPSFKENFSKVTKSEVKYFIQNDKIALSSLLFTNSATGKSYRYSNTAGLNYTQYEINADSFNFESVRISKTTTSTVRSLVRPTCEILSPKMGDVYSTGKITIRYLVKVGEGLTYNLRVSVNGEDVQPEYPTGTAKGVKVALGNELTINVPRRTDEVCNIAMWVVDSEGTLGEPQKIRLSYVGEKPKPRLHIFAVGVSDYPAKDLSNLSYASKDAKDFINIIKSSNTDIYSEVLSTSILDKNASRYGVLSGLKSLLSTVDQGDVVMVYFSGHGIKEGEQVYYMTHDASAAECFRGVEFSTIKSTLKSLTEDKKCHVALFVDTCYSGAMWGMKGSTQEFSMTLPGLVGFYSSAPNQQSREIKEVQNGVFTHVLLEGLKGAAKNKEGEITTNSLESYIKSGVKKLVGNNQQDPIVENMLGDAVLFKVKK